MYKFCCGAALACAFSVFAMAPSAQAQIVVDETFVEHQIEWRGTTSKWIARWRPFVVDGNVAICGVATTTSAKLRNLTKQAVRDMEIKVDGERVVKDLSFFSRVRSSSDMDSAKSGCYVSEIAMPASGGQWYIGSSKKRYRN